MKFYINDREVCAREGQSILDAALEAGIFIPHLCSHPDLEAKGGCRLCVVEIQGMDKPVPACTTMPTEGMRVSVNGPKADKVRRMSMELILATHPADCTGCPKYGKCELQSMYQYMGVSPERWRKKSRSVANDDSNPLIQHLFTRCIRCGRCIRACQDLRGVKVLDYIKTDIGIRAGIPDGKTLKKYVLRDRPFIIVRPETIIKPGSTVTLRWGSLVQDVQVAHDEYWSLERGGYIQKFSRSTFGKILEPTQEDIPENYSDVKGLPTIRNWSDGRVYSIAGYAIVCRAKSELVSTGYRLTKNVKLFPDWAYGKYITGNIGDYLLKSEVDGTIYIEPGEYFEMNYRESTNG